MTLSEELRRAAHLYERTLDNEVYAVLLKAANHLDAGLESELAAVRAELQPFLDAKKEAEIRAAKFDEWAESLGPEPERTEAEEQALSASIADMFKPCETCGRGFSSIEEENCRCCGTCLRLREALGGMLQLHVGDTRDVIEKARIAYHQSDPLNWQLWELKHAFTQAGLVACTFGHDDPRTQNGWIVLVGSKEPKTWFGKVVENPTAITRVEPTKAFPLRAALLRGQTREEHDFMDTESLVECVLGYYRERGLLPTGDAATPS